MSLPLFKNRVRAAGAAPVPSFCQGHRPANAHRSATPSAQASRVRRTAAREGSALHRGLVNRHTLITLHHPASRCVGRIGKTKPRPCVGSPESLLSVDVVPAFQGRPPLSSRRAIRSNRTMWISGPITTVHNEHICHELAVVGRVGLATKGGDRTKTRAPPWFLETIQ